MYKARIKGSNIITPEFPTLEALHIYMASVFPSERYEHYESGSTPKTCDGCKEKKYNVGNHINSEAIGHYCDNCFEELCKFN